MQPIDLLDVNVWLALAVEDHPHHERARHYWEQEGAPCLAFCRITMLGLLRLSTHSQIMAGHPFSPAEAWTMYRGFRALPEIRFLPEPPELEADFAELSGAVSFSAALWTDAYLASLARLADCRLISFDKDFAKFPDLTFLQLRV
ncbi:MAG TPA: TA system VapC family ribonuclease toxin [Chthoniobacterales bacterium]